MAEALAAIGFASNIVQFISFGSTLLSKGHEIYTSADGALIEYLELEAITKNLQELNGRLCRSDEPSTKTNKQLKDLCRGCGAVTAELLGALQNLKAESKYKRWNSFRQALASVWSQDKIQGLSERLDAFRRQINTTLLVLLWDRIDEAEKTRQKYLDDAEKSQDGNTKHISRLFFGLADDTKRWQADLIDTLYTKKWQAKNEDHLVGFSAKLSDAAKSQREDDLKEKLLHRLRFHSMADRYEQIPEAHKRTFEWIFDPPGEGEDSEEEPEQNIEELGNRPARSRRSCDNFLTWLRGSDSLYWITGKPGSGKSTLMKLLYNDARTRGHLKQWVSGHSLVTAGFFFWNSGTTMQMSREGLLQALLHQALEARPGLVPRVFPDRWKAYNLLGDDLHPWGWQELTRAIKESLSDHSLRFLLFVDGLDEFDGKSSDLIDILTSIAASSNVKICVASRPWLAFEEAFRDTPGLKLEELTSPDIRLFVTSKLKSNDRFAELEQQHPQPAYALIGDVTEKASGVFLWVHLVVASLLRGLRDGAWISELQRKVLELPSDLEQLFKRILDSLEPSYFEHASQIFQIVRAAGEPISLVDLAFAERGVIKALEAKVTPLPTDEMVYLAETMRRRLVSRCQGLVEISSDDSKLHLPHARVQYLHRTVKDFMAREEIWNYVLTGTSRSGTFDPLLAMCASFLLQLKTLRPFLEVASPLWQLVRSCIWYAAEAKASTDEMRARYLDGVDAAASELLGSPCAPYPQYNTWLEAILRDPLTARRSPHWTNTEYLSGRWTHGRSHSLNSFFDYAFHSHIYYYVKVKLGQGLPVTHEIDGKSLLLLAILPLDVQMVRLLLNCSADPNRLQGELARSPWQLLLGMAEHKARDHPEVWLEAMEIFLEHDADPQVTVDSSAPE